MKRPNLAYCFQNKHHGPCLEDCPAWGKGWIRDRGNTVISNLMLWGIPDVQEVERRGSKSALGNDQGTQESIKEGFLEEMTLLLGLKDK